MAGIPHKDQTLALPSNKNALPASPQKQSKNVRSLRNRKIVTVTECDQSETQSNSSCNTIPDKVCR